MEMRDVVVTSLRHPDEVVLQDVNWTVAAAEFWAVAGLLRTGKSDLLALASGIMRPASGTYHLFGKELTAGFEHERMALQLRIGLVFDGGQLLHHLTLENNIALPLRYHLGDANAQVEQRVRELLEFTGLAQWARRLPNQVNRNWQQRIGLARALALKPELLFLDNPLTGLDPKDAAWWTDTVSALAAGHPVVDGHRLTLVVTADSLEPWRRRVTHLAVLRDRQFIGLGTPEQLTGRQEPWLEELLPMSKRNL
jgi:ABC-type transporter Mla maintaining outer membrane lipid asymmetry ATPase subunit MlaF